MSFITDFIRELPIYLLSLPVILMALSVHEASHGYVAWKLGDPTARNLGRITLNPVKHLDLIGTLCMIFLKIGWAKPVPINTRNFKNPRRDMALTGAAGPLSNLVMALLHLLVLRVAMLFIQPAFEEEAYLYAVSYFTGEKFSAPFAFTVVCLAVYLLYVGVSLNLSLTIFNLIPIPPFDGSRIFYVFLPTKWYFAVMKYERYIMIGFIIVFLICSRFGWLGRILSFITEGLLTLVGLNDRLEWIDNSMLDLLMYYVGNLIG